MRKDPSQKLNIKTKISPESSAEVELQRMKKLTRRQLLLAVGTLLIIVVLIFAMTSAWINNVSKISPLTFKTTVWGIDENKITVTAPTVNAAPGTGGDVVFSVDNTENEENIKLSVTIRKDKDGENNVLMEEEMRKRVFFYADEQYTENAETVERKYIGATAADAYEYNVAAGNELIVNGASGAGTPIKWEWVYDMTGYYFRAKASISGSATDGFTFNGFENIEYIRPIEYDYDTAIYDSYGNLASVGGVSRADFLTDISSHDGYQGTIDASSAAVYNSKIYYTVSVDMTTGEGVWAYLCTRSEIEAGIEYENSLSNGTFKAQMTLTATNIQTTP